MRIKSKLKSLFELTTAFVYSARRFFYRHLSKDHCVYVSLIGGLGNQLFQYWAGVVLSRKINAKLVLDFSAFEQFYKIHNFSIEFLLENHKLSERSAISVNPSLKKLLSIYKEPHFHYDKNLLNQKTPIMIEGFWQSYKYFDHLREEIITALKPKKLSDEASKLKKIILQSTKVVSLHIRRGDYTDEACQKKHGLMPFEYYNKAMSMIAGGGGVNILCLQMILIGSTKIKTSLYTL